MSQPAMTDKQARYLARLCERANRSMPDGLTTRDAAKLIRELGGGWLGVTEVREAAGCPECRAQNGVPCRRPDGAERPRHHAARVIEARRLLRP